MLHAVDEILCRQLKACKAPLSKRAVPEDIEPLQTHLDLEEGFCKAVLCRLRFRKGGRVICSSIPTYGTGEEAGNEAGYLVGMSTCYPSPGSIKISAGETLHLVSNYSSTRRHTGVMGLFYILVADSSVNSNTMHHSPPLVHWNMMAFHLGWPIALFGVALVFALVLIFNGKNGRGEGYEEI